MTAPERDQEATSPTVRSVRDSDVPGIISLVGRCFAEYPGCVLDVEGEEPQLLTPEASFERFWVVEHEGRIIGMIACQTHENSRGGTQLELKKLYLDARSRGHGLARKLVELVEEYARGRGIAIVDLWTDTRFVTAHSVYTHFGYSMQSATRELHDKSNTVEYYFTKTLAI